MPERLDEYEPEAGSGRPELYPWTEWFNGTTIRLRRGDDFTSHTRSFADAARKAANRYEYLCTIYTEKDDNGKAIAVVIKPETPPKGRKAGKGKGPTLNT